MNRESLLCIFFALPLLSFANDEGKSNLEEVREFLNDYNKKATDISRRSSEANWAYQTNLVDSNLENVVRVANEESEFNLNASRRAAAIKTLGLPADILRQVTFIRRSADPKSEENRNVIQEAIGEMRGIFGKAEIFKTQEDGTNKSYALDPELNAIFKESRDPEELLWAWKGFRDAVGPPTKLLFERMVDLLNVGAKEHGWKDYGDFVRSEYEMGDGLQPSLQNVWSTIEPLYKELHAYVRHKLQKKYGSQTVTADGSIPAHLLGDMYAQTWEYIFDLVKPKQDSKSFDITSRLQDLDYTAEKMVSDAESFFKSISLYAMPDSFWKQSVFRKIPDKAMVCHPTAWDFTGSDVRLSMCIEVNQEHYTTIHHEMGHLEYVLAYNDQPFIFKGAANPGFHEAIGDTVALSVETPTYLHEKKLIQSAELSSDDRISFLLYQALRKLAPIPYNLLVDEWRWRVFDGTITQSSYNKEWWKFRVKYQGVAPPIERPREAFDPASKIHIVVNAPYVVYFVSFVLQFQLHKALCKEAGYTGPLYQCSVYGSKKAGQKFKSMLQAGRSKPWQKILEAATGDRELKADPILEYFQPLREWLEKKRKEEKYPIGWDESKIYPTTHESFKKHRDGRSKARKRPRKEYVPQAK